MINESKQLQYLLSENIFCSLLVRNSTSLLNKFKSSFLREKLIIRATRRPMLSILFVLVDYCAYDGPLTVIKAHWFCACDICQPISQLWFAVQSVPGFFCSSHFGEHYSWYALSFILFFQSLLFCFTIDVIFDFSTGKFLRI